MQLLAATFVPLLRPSEGPSLAGYRWVAEACANKVFSCPISLVPEGELICSWFQAQETTSQGAVPTDPEAAQSLLGPRDSTGLGEK